VLAAPIWRRSSRHPPDCQVNGLDYAILGVAPKGFIGTELLFIPEIWVRMSMQAQIEPGKEWLNHQNDWNIWVLGRIKFGISRQQAQSEIDSIAAQQWS
jgi:macrolide transport system ATP-binding/permease protein